MGKPSLSPDGMPTWERDMRNLARHPNVTVKLSGAGVHALPGAKAGAQALPFIQKTLDIFGSDRCMFGSDWPVSIKTPSGYSYWSRLVLEEAMTGASPSELKAVASGTAQRFYGLTKD
jgi:L-fuconolactonase